MNRTIALTACGLALSAGIAAAALWASAAVSRGPSHSSAAVLKEMPAYLTVDSAPTLINAKISGVAISSAAPEKPVLLFECATSLCEDEDVNLVSVSKALDGRVIVLALDPYKNRLLAQSIRDGKVAPALMNSLSKQMLMQYLASQKQDPTPELVAKILQDPDFRNSVQRTVGGSELMEDVYPKVFLFKAGTFDMVAGMFGLDTRDELMRFASQGMQALDQAKAAEEQALKDDAARAKAAITGETPAAAASPEPVPGANKP